MYSYVDASKNDGRIFVPTGSCFKLTSSHYQGHPGKNREEEEYLAGPKMGLCVAKKQTKEHWKSSMTD